MPPPVFTVGQIAAASDVNAWFVPLAAVKVSDTSRASNTTLTADPELSSVAFPGAGTWYLQCYLDYEGGATSAGLSVQFTSTTGTLRYTAVNATALGGVNMGGTFAGGATIAMLTSGAGVLQGATFHGTLVTAGSGSITLNWAQTLSNATAAIMHAQSYMALARIS